MRYLYVKSLETIARSHRSPLSTGMRILRLSKNRHRESRNESEECSVKTIKSDKIRASVSFPTDIYTSLEDIAREKKVSIAWVVREAAEKYVIDRWPLLGHTERNEE